MKRYRIEVYTLGVLIGYWDTDDIGEARQIYWAHNNRLDRWTVLYIDGKTGPKAWMDRMIGGGMQLNYMVESMSIEAVVRQERKKGRKKT